MTKTQLITEKLSLDSIHHFSQLGGLELLSQITQFLHRTFNSHSSMVIELDKMRYKAHNLSCASVAYFGAFRSVISGLSDHPFRFKPITDSAIIRSLLA
ncbi:diguanylate cyclase/phosphodiesterase with PAS/PAC sensor(s) [Vibrio cholerae]|nr:diguanylate cyclase/phosphodiesterase with PAS/PAC sensor(s) [Vibrio cholerae]